MVMTYFTQNIVAMGSDELYKIIVSNMAWHEHLSAI